MAFVPYGTAFPALVNYQFQFNGYKFGPGEPFELTKYEGLGLPTVRTGDSGRPRDPGRFAGLDVMDGRDSVMEGDLHRDSISFQHALDELAAATLSSGAIEVPLFASLPGFGTLGSMARVRKRLMPVDVQFSLGNLAKVTLGFGSTDPRWYGETKQASVKAPTTSAGFSFPLSFPLSFGGGSVAGALSLNNEGNIEMRPILIVEGPCTNPSITNGSIAEAPTLAFNLVMAAGDKLVIDTDMHTALYYTSGSTIGSTRLYTLAKGSRWFPLNPGVNLIQFLAESAATLYVQYASAFIV